MARAAAALRKARDVGGPKCVAMSAVLAADPTTGHVAVPLCGITGRGPLSFPVYLRTASDALVLYRDQGAQIAEDQVDRLFEEGVREFWIRGADRAAYLHRVEHSLGEILNDKRASVERRADVLHGVALTIAEESLQGRLSRESVTRSQRMLVSASSLLLRESCAFGAMRALLGASESLAQHSVTTAFLAMGLARHALSADAATVAMAGLAGLLHDTGRIGHEHVANDPDHAQRGYVTLRSLGLSPEVCAAALSHHERHDGSGHPQRLRGAAIPSIARVVGLVDAFDEVYSAQPTKLRVFDALRSLAEAWQGCFDASLSATFVKLFR